MTDYRKILMLRSMGCSQREMERNKIASRETSKAVFETARIQPHRLQSQSPCDLLHG